MRAILASVEILDMMVIGAFVELGVFAAIFTVDADAAVSVPVLKVGPRNSAPVNCRILVVLGAGADAGIADGAGSTTDVGTGGGCGATVIIEARNVV